MGDYAGAEHHSKQGIALYDRERDHRLTYIYSGHDPGVCADAFRGLCKATGRGRPSARSLPGSARTGHGCPTSTHDRTRSLGLSYAHVPAEPVEAQRAAEREIAICEEYLLPLLLSQGSSNSDGHLPHKVHSTRASGSCRRA